MNSKGYFLREIITRTTLCVLCLLFTGKAWPQGVNHWEALVKAENLWSYFPGYSEPPYGWYKPEFNASSWATGPGGFGYGDNDDATVIPAVTSVYILHTFQVSNPAAILVLLLYADFDDGFVAYLNGTEVARLNMGTTSLPPFSKTAVEPWYEVRLPTGGTPIRFILRPEHVQSLKTGSNVLALQVHNFSAASDDLSSSAFLIAGISGTGNSYQPCPSWFVNPYTERSHLPLVLIDTNGQNIPNEPKITVNFRVIDNGPGKTNNIFDNPAYFNGLAGIEVRGQSSRMFEKKSYGFEIRDPQGEDIKVSLLGMPSESDWILYAPFSDKTLLRNALTYNLGRRMGRWQPGFRFCEVYLNGTYAGIYQLTEKIKRDKERVNIAKLSSSDISGDAVTGGYIVKVDKIQDLSPSDYFYNHPAITFPNSRPYAWTWVYPEAEDLARQQRDWFMNYIRTVENSINSSSFKNPGTGYPAYLDIPSFIDFQIMNELANNVDGYRYSTFFHKNRDSQGGKLVAGPLWDFDLCYGNVDYAPDRLATDRWLYTGYGPGEWNCMHWWARLMQDPAYAAAIKQRYSLLRKGILHTDSITKTIDDYVILLGDAIGRNFIRWNILGEDIWPNPEVRYTHTAEIDFLRNWITNRMDWMDTQWLVPVTGERDSALSEMAVYPNPFRDFLHINLPSHLSGISLQVFDIRGVKVFSGSDLHSVDGTLKVNLFYLSDGIYLIRITGNGTETITGKIIKKQ